jgi:hypothetical protein
LRSNWHFKDWCERRGITFTRGRSHHSNDNCFVEQKNGDVVRKTVGYARFEGEEVCAALANVYRKKRAIQTKAALDIVSLQDSLERACQELEYLVTKNHG